MKFKLRHLNALVNCVLILQRDFELESGKRRTIYDFNTVEATFEWSLNLEKTRSRLESDGKRPKCVQVISCASNCAKTGKVPIVPLLESSRELAFREGNKKARIQIRLLLVLASRPV